MIPKPDGGSEFLVVSGTFGVPENGKKIRIRNVTGTLVKVTFHSVIFTGPPVEIPNGVSKPVDLKMAPVDVYDYDVDVHVQGAHP